MFKSGDFVCLNELGKKALGGNDPVSGHCIKLLLGGGFLKIHDVISHPWGADSVRFFDGKYSFSSTFFTKYFD